MQLGMVGFGTDGREHGTGGLLRARGTTAWFFEQVTEGGASLDRGEKAVGSSSFADMVKKLSKPRAHLADGACGSGR